MNPQAGDQVGQPVRILQAGGHSYRAPIAITSTATSTSKAVSLCGSLTRC